jgi:hypothetical protein
MACFSAVGIVGWDDKASLFNPAQYDSQASTHNQKWYNCTLINTGSFKMIDTLTADMACHSKYCILLLLTPDKGL